MLLGADCMAEEKHRRSGCSRYSAPFWDDGCAPRIEWLRGCVALDDKGFILTGRDLDTAGQQGSSTWPLARAPQMLETSLPSVFAVGDARPGNVKRVASVVGEGAISVHIVHQPLVEL